ASTCGGKTTVALVFSCRRRNFLYKRSSGRDDGQTGYIRTRQSWRSRRTGKTRYSSRLVNPGLARGVMIMQCPPEIVEIVAHILQVGLVRIRALGWQNNAGRCAVEADHLHNLPT